MELHGTFDWTGNISTILSRNGGNVIHMSILIGAGSQPKITSISDRWPF